MLGPLVNIKVDAKSTVFNIIVTAACTLYLGGQPRPPKVNFYKHHRWDGTKAGAKLDNHS